MRLNADVLLRAESYINAVRERELNLRGFKIPAIENLSVLQDQYDSIDLSDNDIRKLDNFPTMPRLNTLLMSNNSIVRIAPDLSDHLPHLHHLTLMNNKISSYQELQHLSNLVSLQHLSLLENPICYQPQYRPYTIYVMRGLKSLDFSKVTAKERDEATTFFEGIAEGQAFLRTVDHSAHIASSAQGKQQVQREELKTVIERGAAMSNLVPGPFVPAPLVQRMPLTEQQKQEIKEAIGRAVGKEEVDTIERQLKLGTFPFKSVSTEAGVKRGRDVEDPDEQDSKIRAGREVLAL